MSIAYWNQWDREELNSMHGLEALELDFEQDDLDADFLHVQCDCVYCAANSGICLSDM